MFFLRQMRKYLLPVLDVLAYCLMPTHYHLLIQVKQSSRVSKIPELFLSQAMMRFGVSYSMAVNKRFNRVGSLFQGRFKAKHIGTDRYLLYLSAYMHRNPVEAGLASTAADWEFSSYRDYVGQRGGTLPMPDLVLAQFKSSVLYKEYVESFSLPVSELTDCLVDEQCL